MLITYPDSKVHGANTGPTWVLSPPDGPHVGPMNLSIRICLLCRSSFVCYAFLFIHSHNGSPKPLHTTLDEHSESSRSRNTEALFSGLSLANIKWVYLIIRSFKADPKPLISSYFLIIRLFVYLLIYLFIHFHLQKCWLTMSPMTINWWQFHEKPQPSVTKFD